MNAIIPSFKTPHFLLRELEGRLRGMYPQSGLTKGKFNLLPDLSLLCDLLPESVFGGMDLVGLNHLGKHFPYEQSREREICLNAFSSEGQLMKAVSIGSNTKYGPLVQVNTFVRLTRLHDPDPLWLELGVDTCAHPYIHADFAIARQSQESFDIWFTQYTSGSRPKSGYDNMESNGVLFVKCEGVKAPLPQYSITSRNGLVSWHFRTSDRNISPLEWPSLINES